MAKYTHLIDGVVVDFTPAEEAARDAQIKAWNDSALSRKLDQIKNIRQQKLQETDWMANSDVTMSDSWKTKRQSWRDIPQNNSTEAEYDTILARDADGNLTNTIWSNG